MKRASLPRWLGPFALGLSAALLAGGDSSARADVKLPNVCGSHRVLQRKQKNRVWGWADLGEGVTITIGDQSQTAQANKGGKWSVTLDPLPAGGPHTRARGTSRWRRKETRSC